MKTMLIHAAELITCQGGPKGGEKMKDVAKIPDGALVWENGTILDVGSTEEILKKYPDFDGTVIQGEGSCVLPGFVDSHTHFLFGGYRADEFGWRLAGDSYMSIMERGGGIASTVKATHKASEEELFTEGKKRLEEMFRMGFTTVEGKSGYGLDRDTELKQLRVMKRLSEDAEQPVDLVSTFLGPHAVPAEYKGREEDYLKFVVEEVLPAVKEENLAEFADIFCEKGVFSVPQSRYYLEEAGKLGFRLKVHADEMADTGGTAMAASLGAVSADHLLKASEDGIRRLADSDTVATLLPLTAFSLKEPFADGRAFIDSGAMVALATDFNPGSCFSNSAPLLIALACIYMKLSIEETITAMTINAAKAICRDGEIGSLEKGKKADILMLQFPSAAFLPYHTGVNCVKTVIKNGVVYEIG